METHNTFSTSLSFDSQLDIEPLDVGRDPLLSETSHSSTRYPTLNDCNVTWSNIEPIGPVSPTASVKVLESKREVEYSEHNKMYHVKSGRDGRFQMNCQFNNMPPLSPDRAYYLQMTLVRRNDRFKHIPVNAVCARHSRVSTASAPIMPVATEDIRGGVKNKKNKHELNSTFFHGNKTCPEAARDLKLLVELVSWNGREVEDIQVLHTEEFNLWIKAQISQQHILKKERREPKGSLAQLIPRKRRQGSLHNEELIDQLRLCFPSFTEEEKSQVRSIVS